MLYVKRTFDFEFPVEESDVALLGIPWDFSETGKPTRFAPVFIREAIKNLFGYDPKTKKNIFKIYKFCDLGDVEVVPGNWSLTYSRIKDTIKQIFQSNPNIFPVFLGGDHLITLGILRSLKLFYEKITIIDFDAHRDLYPNFLGGKFSHLTWAYHVAKDKSFELVQIGTRAWSGEEERILKKCRIKSTLRGIKNPIYLTFDLDVLDISDVGTPEPSGMKFEELVKIIGRIPKDRIIGMDIVEGAPDNFYSRSSVAAANIIKYVLLHRA